MPPALRVSAVMLSSPGAAPFFMSFIATVLQNVKSWMVLPQWDFQVRDGEFGAKKAGVKFCRYQFHVMATFRSIPIVIHQGCERNTVIAQVQHKQV
ncbi:hypothetical protein KIN20_010181 [Parelaphostrongylus tenuis]|uniref:Uncharacterized protein n=1 Tax=Parelaphostrongylus tenuis TaxID=148309 RepID=A0AAD5MC67_PARTN|nr:hypothetical protein KIN20_010181 [Parelaphostrongylus tenuis]